MRVESKHIQGASHALDELILYAISQAAKNSNYWRTVYINLIQLNIILYLEKMSTAL